jgi:hypothetical protein
VDSSLVTGQSAAGKCGQGQGDQVGVGTAAHQQSGDGIAEPGVMSMGFMMGVERLCCWVRNLDGKAIEDAG